MGKGNVSKRRNFNRKNLEIMTNIYKLIYRSTDGEIMILMWTAFLINAVYGYVMWAKGSEAKTAVEVAP